MPKRAIHCLSNTSIKTLLHDSHRTDDRTMLGFSSHYITTFVDDCGKRKLFELNPLRQHESSTWLTLLDGVLVYAEY